MARGPNPQREGAVMNEIVRLADGNDTFVDIDAISDWAALLAFALAQPDAEIALPQLHRVGWQTIDHARASRCGNRGGDVDAANPRGAVFAEPAGLPPAGFSIQGGFGATNRNLR